MLPLLDFNFFLTVFYYTKYYSPKQTKNTNTVKKEDQVMLLSLCCLFKLQHLLLFFLSFLLSLSPSLPPSLPPFLPSFPPSFLPSLFPLPFIKQLLHCRNCIHVGGEGDGKVNIGMICSLFPSLEA